MGDLYIKLKYIEQEIERVKHDKEKAIQYANVRLEGLTEEKYKLLKFLNEEQEKKR